MTAPTTATGAAASQDGYAFGSPRAAWSVLLILCCLNIGSYMDRQIINLLVEQIRRDFQVSDVQVSLLQGLAFALFYSVVALPIGWVADRWNRRSIVVIGATFWSVATLVCMIAKDYPTLFVARMLVGLGEAALIPAGFSLLSDYFPRARVSSAVSSVTGASFLGNGLALTVGGITLAHLPQTGQVALPVVGSVFGWQLAFGVVTIPSLIMIVFMCFVREPPRRGVAEIRPPAPKLRDLLGFLNKDRGFWLALVGGMVFMNCYQYGLSAWVVTFFIRTYGWEAQRIGGLYGTYFFTIGLAAAIFGGVLCDRLVKMGRSDANLLIPLGAAIVALPVTVIFALCGNAMLSAVLLAVLTFVAVAPFGPAIAAIPLLAPNNMRAQLLAYYMLTMTLVGSTSGPWLIANATDNLYRDPSALKYSIALCAAATLSVAIVCLDLGRRRMRRVAAQAAASPTA